MSPAAINPLMSVPLDKEPLPEILYLDQLPDSSMFTWNWPAVCKRVIQEGVLLVTKNKFVYHSLVRALPKKGRYHVRRREHKLGYVYQIADPDTTGPITTRSNQPAQKSSHGVYRKMALELMAGGRRPEGAVMEMDYKTAFVVRTRVYNMIRKQRLKFGIAMRVRQEDGSYLPLKKVTGFEKKMVTLFCFSLTHSNSREPT